MAEAEKAKETKSLADMSINELSKSGPIVVLLHVISSPTRILGLFVVGFFALIFGIFIYPGNDRLQNVLFRYFEPAPKIAEAVHPAKAVVAVAPSAAIAPPAVSPVVAPVAIVQPPPIALPAPARATPAGSAGVSSSGEKKFPDLESALKSLWPNASDADIRNDVAFYRSLKTNSALAARIGRRTVWPYGEAFTAEQAKLLSLERCNLLSGEACVLVAVGPDIVLPEDQNTWQPVSSTRIGYSSRIRAPYRSDMVPGAKPDQMQTLLAYQSATETRALVIDPFGRSYFGMDAESLFEAESKAFKGCYDFHVGKPHLCVLYAKNDLVFFSERRTFPKK
jgi:hypothetical protein